MADTIIVKPTQQAPIKVEANASKTPIKVGGGSGSVNLAGVAKETTLLSAKEEIIEAVKNAQVDIDTSNLASKNLEDFFEVVPDDSEEIMTDEEITQELEDIFNTIFN